ncbi:MAG: hypothetical protein JWQ71_2938 [Pedosphaera sp.]|nr:hypothetical protein [Pedosphaera sp.]
MILRKAKKSRDRTKLGSIKTRNEGKCSGRRSKCLKYDTAVPGDRGDCEKQSLVQGSE